jgi:hypothetical protein
VDSKIISDFITIFLGITVEALPFLVLGVTVSVIVSLFVNTDKILAMIPKNRFLSFPIISLFGIFMPVCECGNVPVARRLLLSKFSVAQTITFLIAAPILNPITFLSTFEAFNFDREVVIWRMAGAYFIAVFVGILISLASKQNSFLTSKFEKKILTCEHDHNQDNVSEGLSIFRSEFLTSFKLLIFGAMIAAVTQTFIPRPIIESIGSSPVLSIVAMMVLAFVVSICSNIDAFFALAYVNTFTTGSIVAFLIFGPMIDIKLLTMLKDVFTVKFLAMLTIIIAQLSFIIGLVVNII